MKTVQNCIRDEHSLSLAPRVGLDVHCRFSLQLMGFSVHGAAGLLRSLLRTGALSFHLTPGSRCWLQREPHPAGADALVSSSLLSKKGAKTPLVPTTTNPAGGGPDPPTSQQERTELVVLLRECPGSQSGIRRPQRHSLPGKMTFRCPFVIPNRSRGDTDISELYIAQKVLFQAS